MGPDTSEINDESQESTDISNNLSQIYEKKKENDNNKGKKANQFDIKNIVNHKGKETKIDDSKIYLESKEKEKRNKNSQNKSIYNAPFITMNNNFFVSETGSSSFDIASLKKKYLANCYQLKRELDKLQKVKNLEEKKKENDLTLEPKYKKGIQIIFKPFEYDTIGGKIFKDILLFKLFKYGHILVRYYDKNIGDDVFIESGSEKNSIYNEIKISNFKKEDFKTYIVIQEEELLGNEKYLEKVKDYLYKKYNKDGKLIRGKYSVRYNCCFHTAEEIMPLFGKSDEKIRELYDKEIKTISPWFDRGHHYYNHLLEFEKKN